MTKETAQKIYNSLMEKGEPVSELDYANNYQLLVAAMLSPQTPDRLTNKITPEIFKKYKNLEELAKAEFNDLFEIIRPINFNKTKALNLINAAKTIVNSFAGEIPQTIEELTTMNGIGRKVAQVVLIEGFKIPAMPVDTHVLRTANRLGISESKSPQECENDIRELFLKSTWCNLHKALVLHGRYVCTAPKPKCEGCALKKFCKFYNS